MASKTQGEVMNEFMKLVWVRMHSMSHYQGTTGGQFKSKNDDHKTCRYCHEVGHFKRYCPSKGADGRMSNVTDRGSVWSLDGKHH